MHAGEVVAMGYRYPVPGAIEELAVAVDRWTRGGINQHLTRFIGELRSLPLGPWEELHTATLDLSPLFVPYVGHVVWGENYRRGEFMADLNLAMNEAAVNLDGELPDHIAPILRYLSVSAEPLADLVQVLPGAVDTMAKTLTRAASDNPYRHLLAATAEFAGGLAIGSADLTGGSAGRVDAPRTSRTEFRLRRGAGGKATWTGVGEVGR